jgi:metal-responsive CopG/Arc/MetJ family transcriptional regulator
MKKTIQITIDAELLDSVDQAARELGITRSAFIREALQQAVQAIETRKLEEQHAAGYRRHPVVRGEFGV